MRRTTIYLDPELETRLKTESARQKVPMAELIRQAIREKLDSTQPARSPHGGRFASGRSDVADRAEEVLREGDFGQE